MTQDHGTDVLRPTPDEDVPADVHDRVLDILRAGMAEPDHRPGRSPWVLAVAAAAAVAVLVGGVVGVTRLVADSPPDVAAPQLPTTQVTVPATTAPPTSTAPTTTVPPTTTSAAPALAAGFPEQVADFGSSMYQQAWAVYVFAGSAGSQAGEIAAARTSLTSLGYTVRERTPSCDYDAFQTAQLGGTRTYDTTVALYFSSAAAAQQFASAYDGDVRGSGRVVNFCAPGARERPAVLTPVGGLPVQDLGPYDAATTYYGVYLDPTGTDPEDERVQLGALGYYAASGYLSCDALQADPVVASQAMLVVVGTAAQAARLSAAYDGVVVGTVAMPGDCLASYSPTQISS